MLPIMNFPIQSFDQMNPGLVRANKLMDLLGKGMNTYGQYQQAKIAPEMSQAALQKALADTAYREQESKWYGPKAQSGIDLQGSQGNYYNSQSNQMNQMLPYKIAEQQLLQKYPLLGKAGDAGTIEATRYYDDLKKQQGTGSDQFPGLEQQMRSGNPDDLTIKPEQYERVAASLGGSATLNPTGQESVYNLPGQEAPSATANQKPNVKQLLQSQVSQPGSGQGVAPQVGQVAGPQSNDNLSPADALRNVLKSKAQEREAHTNYMKSMPGIRAASNSITLASAATNRDAARGVAQTLLDQTSPGVKATEADVDAVMEHASNLVEKKGNTAALLNMRMYGNVLSGLFKQADVNFPAFAQYAGAGGGALLMRDKAISAITGKPSPRLIQYSKFITDASNTANEIGRTLGKGATDQQNMLTQKLSKPNYWYSNMDLAAAQWQELKDTFAGPVNEALAKGTGQTRKALQAETAQQHAQKIPSLQEFISANKAANPDYTDQEMAEIYKQTYGG